MTSRPTALTKRRLLLEHHSRRRASRDAAAHSQPQPRYTPAAWAGVVSLCRPPSTRPKAASVAPPQWRRTGTFYTCRTAGRVTAHRSDATYHTANNTGELTFLLRVAYGMMPAYTDREVAKTDGLRTSAPQQRTVLQALARQGRTGPGMPRLLLHTRPTHGRSLL